VSSRKASGRGGPTPGWNWWGGALGCAWADLLVVGLWVLDHRVAAVRRAGWTATARRPWFLRPAAGGSCLTDVVRDAAILLEGSLLYPSLPLPQHGILQMEIGLLLETLQGHNGGAAVITYLVNLNLA
jgi:hypothetical protein